MSTYNGTNKRSVDAFKAENGNARFNIIPSTTGKTYVDPVTKQNTGIGMLFFSCAGQTGYVTLKSAKALDAAGKDWTKALQGMLVVDHEVTNKETGKVENLACLEVDSPNARYSY